MIESLKDLEKLLKLCRKQGITDIELGNIKLKFGDLPSDKSVVLEDEITSDNPYANFPDTILTPSQLAFYSAGGDPSEDPELVVGQ